jgi:hypothetical protein
MTTAIAAINRFDRRVAVRSEADLDRLRFMAVIGLVVLNACDLLLTRKLLGMGLSEMNPMMPWSSADLGASPSSSGSRSSSASVTFGAR